MHDRIESGQLLTLEPVEPSQVEVDDVVLVQWKGNYLLHVVQEIHGNQLLIRNNIGKINGWVPAGAVKGRVSSVQD